MNETEVLAAIKTHRADQMAAELTQTAIDVASYYRTLTDGGVPPESATEFTHITQEWLLQLRFGESLGNP